MFCSLLKILRLNWLLPVTQLPPKAARLNLLKGKKVMMHLKFSKISKAKSVVSKNIETESISSGQSVISKSSKVEPNELKGDDDASVVSKFSRAKSVVSKSNKIGPTASESSKTASQITDVK
jgi:hypothetical protein